MNSNLKLALELALFWGLVATVILLPTVIEIGTWPRWTPGLLIGLFFAGLLMYAGDTGPRG